MNELAALAAIAAVVVALEWLEKRRRLRKVSWQSEAELSQCDADDLRKRQRQRAEREAVRVVVLLVLASGEVVNQEVVACPAPLSITC